MDIEFTCFDNTLNLNTVLVTVYVIHIQTITQTFGAVESTTSREMSEYTPLLSDYISRVLPVASSELARSASRIFARKCTIFKTLKTACQNKS